MREGDDDPAPALDHSDKMKIRNAATRAKRMYPGPVGLLVAQELNDWADFGYLFDNRGQVARLLAHICDAPVPG